MWLVNCVMPFSRKIRLKHKTIVSQISVEFSFLNADRDYNFLFFFHLIAL